MTGMRSILLLEDDRLVAHSLLCALESAGYQVTLARTLASARIAVQGQSYDLMILDIGLPDGSGLDFARQLREEKRDTPFVFLTAYKDEAVVRAGITLGARSYLVKPILADQLLPLVASTLAAADREIEQLAKARAAIDSNRVISAAAGMLAVQNHMTTEEALVAMRRLARDRQMKLEALAGAIISDQKKSAT